MFNNACQRADESLDHFATWLSKLVTYCKFDHFKNEAEIRLWITEGYHSIGFNTKYQKKHTLNKILTMAGSKARATSHSTHMENGRVRMTEQAHHIAGNSSRQDKPSLPLKEKHEWTCYRCSLEYPHVGACLAMGHKCRKCNSDNHFASICMGGHIKAERGRPARPRITLS
ncbi:hypothetical protein NDU88_001014 [Pleurodeles waltl]|uniref:Uncharacterized protein n=1 Tax=Pleurodeles waltl TaxID=8319 RepID=A0AAV7S7D5_PLEWA|nr:hypothetical protein NDU88_001014 [Pleurodeles waltl]